MFTVIAVFFFLLCLLCRRKLNICVHFLGHFLSMQIYVSGGLRKCWKE